MLQHVQQELLKKNNQLFLNYITGFLWLISSTENLFFLKNAMKNNFNNIFSNFLKIILLVALCLGVAFAIVWPLWKFSTTFSKTYTIIICTIIFIALLYIIITKIKNSKPVKTFQFFSNLILIAAGLYFSVTLVISGKRIFSLITLLLLIVLELLINYLFSKKTNS